MNKPKNQVEMIRLKPGMQIWRITMDMKADVRMEIVAK